MHIPSSEIEQINEVNAWYSSSLKTNSVGLLVGFNLPFPKARGIIGDEGSELGGEGVRWSELRMRMNMGGV